MSIPKAYIDTDAGQIHYRSLPAEGTPVVFLHQTASSSAMYIKVMEKLAGKFPLYALDTPGFGGSFDPEGMPSLSQYCDWILAAIDTLGLDKFHLFGHHTGSCIGVEIAARHPKRVLSLMMTGPVPLTQDERNEFRKHYSTPFSPTPDGTYLMDTWQYLEGLGANSDLDLHHRELVDTLRAYMGRYQIYSAVWDQDFSSFYADVSCPILILSAEDDVLNPFFDRAKEIRPDANVVMLKGANFEPDLDSDGTVAAIISFLQPRLCP